MKRTPVDVVAIVLAIGLAGAVVGILVATTVQIVRGNPDIALSDNATQIIVGAVGAMTGLLGGYMGSRRPHPRADDDDDDEKGDDSDG